MTDDDANEDPQIKPFAAILRDLNGGRTHDELSEALWELNAKVRETGKKGSLQLTLTVEPTKGDTYMLTVSDDINCKPPKPARRPSVFFDDGHGNLSRSNPNQPELDGLREVPGRITTNLKEAN